MTRKNVAIWAMTVLLASTSRGALVEWSTGEGGNGHLYEAVVVSSPISWTVARDAAFSKGGYLVTITSPGENAFVFDLIDDDKYWMNTNGPWLGGYQVPGSSEPDGGWRWVVDDEDEAVIYTNWRPGEPSNSNFGENSLHFCHAPGTHARSPYWNDISADGFPGSIRSYVVEYIPEPATLLLLGLGGLVLRRRGR